MKKNKPKYSLTSKQRKQLRQKDAPAAAPKDQDDSIVPQDDLVFSAPPEGGALTAPNNQKSRRNYIITLVAICMVIVLAISGITVGTVFLVRNSRGNFNNLGLVEGADIVNPIATINLSTGQSLQIELFMHDNRGAVANLIYLAENNFFNNTIFHNSANGFLAFSGFETPTHHRSYNEGFMRGLSGFSARPTQIPNGLERPARSPLWRNENFKLGYRINATNTAIPQGGQEGWLGFMASANADVGSSTSFVMFYNNSPQTNLVRRTSATAAERSVLMSGPTSVNSISHIGRLTPQSLAIVQQIGAMPRTPAPASMAHRWTNFENPTENIMITSISFSSLDRRLRRNIVNDFENFVLENNELIRHPDGFGARGSLGWQRTELGNWSTYQTVNWVF
ncbi:MAG: peptidylprolyl isomerase [Firmicutes bacterium]|nr:peptidylprolyl isomerase [Bacillota bacterium]